ncbi:hypothetical protein GCM10007094_17900 [Pseudovibrio japonicus]|uniref:Rieske domain-containing protein n=1 Tax=Pseudovibrio japonicus TaxID=366534 RepID=A0ABQ3E8C2_9HYPH|nr:arsenate reductase (azurin) small subunit [Pseudovibrio japonicus]GHB29939.1 hypothetical protein GCM10007094_17900 [Pseudovibrio japonicus]
MRCRKLVDIGRRQFLTGGAVAAAASATALLPTTTQAQQMPIRARLDYPSEMLANIAELTENVPLDVAYPDDFAPGVLVKFGRAVEGGVGPDADIVGFSTICPHKGFPLIYDEDDRTFSCPGHYSRFDPEAGGMQIWGQATQNLPQYILRVESNGDIFAEGVDELLYGRLSNMF